MIVQTQTPRHGAEDFLLWRWNSLRSSQRLQSRTCLSARLQCYLWLSQCNWMREKGALLLGAFGRCVCSSMPTQRCSPQRDQRTAHEIMKISRLALQSQRDRMHQSRGKKRTIPLLSPFHAHQKYSLWTVIAVENVAQGFGIIKGFYVMILCFVWASFGARHFKTSDLFIIPPTWSMVPNHVRGRIRHM